MKTLFVFTAGLLMSLSASSQILKPVKWSYATKKISSTEAILFMKATIENGWHIYSLATPHKGPVKTTFSFSPAKSFSLEGEVAGPPPFTKYEKAFGTNISYFEKSVVFRQKIKLKTDNVTVKGTIEFMVCSDRQCLPPETIEFAIPVN
jgi:DsbC/DsbD-like thiol-disulfide interchange protein